MSRAFVILLCLFGMIGSVEVHSFQNNTCLQQKCMVVIDAGSTGSRIHVYSYGLSKNNFPINVQETWLRQITPGISSVELNRDRIKEYLNNLFIDIPVRNLPVYFYATAGMRLYSYNKQQQYYQYINEWFTEHQTEWGPVVAKTITGKEEGILGWLAVNYRTSAFEGSSELVSVLDMGGASVQITVPLDEPPGTFSTDVEEVNLNGRSIFLFSHSFLGLGQTLLTQQFLDEPSCFSNYYRLPSGFAAQGDASICAQEVSKLVNVVHDVRQIVKPIVSTNHINFWYALGGVTHLVNEKPLEFHNNQFTLEGLLQQGNEEFCQQPWDQLSSRYPDNPSLFLGCLLSSYYYALLTDGYGIDAETTINYLSNPKATDWTLGVVLRQAQIGGI